jgi:hypothetical protein
MNTYSNTVLRLETNVEKVLELSLLEIFSHLALNLCLKLKIKQSSNAYKLLNLY